MVGIDTRSVHAGETPDPSTGAIATPIHQTTSYAHDGPGKNKGYCYTRTGNPTVDALADKLNALEDGVGGACFGSGLAAVDATFRLLSPGDHVLVSEVAYGGTIRQIEHLHRPWGLDVEYVDTTDPGAVEAAVRPETAMLFVETPANPTLEVAPLSPLGEIAEDRDLIYVVDNTFHTPVLQRPFDHGADLSLHSTTKYLEGHGSTVGGAVVARDDEELVERLRFLANASGNILGPFDAWLTLRGIKTLPLRIRRASRTAKHLAAWLDDHAAVAEVHYPGLPDDPGFEANRRQADAGGAVLSFELVGGLEAAERFLERLELLVLAENLGQAETLLTHPATMSHAALSRQERLDRGIADGLLRISVGYEDPEDLLADLEPALSAARPAEVDADR